MDFFYRLFNSKYFNSVLFISFFLLPFVIYWHLFSSNMVPVSGDGVTYFSTKAFINSCITQGSFPLWNQYLSNGIPCAPDITSGALYPIGLLLAFLPLKFYIYTYYAIHLAIGALFTYLYLKEIGCSKIVAFCTATIFELSIRLGGYRKEHMAIVCTIIWLPVILYFIERYIKTKNIKLLILCSISMAVQFFLADIQDVIYTNITVITYLIFRIINTKIPLKKALKDIFSWGCIYISLIMVQLLPTLQLIYEYKKAGAVGSSFEYSQSYSIHFIKLLMMLFPKIFGNDVYQHFGPGLSSELDIEIFLGVIVFSIILFGIVRYFHEPIIKLTSCMMACSFIYAANAHIPILNTLIYQIPILGDLRVPSRSLFIFTFFGLVIFALILSKLREKEDLKKLVSFIIRLLAVITLVLLTVGIVLLITNVVNGSPIEELQKYYEYGETAFLPTLLLLISFVIILKITEKNWCNQSGKINKKFYKFLIILITIVTLIETWQFTTVYRFTNLNEYIIGDNVTNQIKSDIGYSKVWVALPGMDGGYKSLFSQNSNLIKKVSTLNSYITFNNPRFYKLFSYGQNAPYNCTGLLTGSGDAYNNLNLDNDMLSMLDTKFIIDPFKLIREDGSVTQLLDEGTVIYEKDNIVIPNNNGVLYVFSENVSLKPNTYYKIEYNLESLGIMNAFSIDFYGGEAYDGSLQQKDYSVSNWNNKRYSTYLFSGDTSESVNTQVRIIARPTSEIIFTDFKVSEVKTRQINNVYKPYLIDKNNRIFENTHAKGILYVVQNIQTIKDVEDIYNNGLLYDFLTTDFVQDYRNFDLSSVKTEIVVKEYKGNSIRAEVKSSGTTFVNFSQNYYPGWKAYIDGKETTIYLVNGLIQGIEVPQGEHIIEFKFTSPMMLIGGIISLISLIVVIWVITKKRNHSDREVA